MGLNEYRKKRKFSKTPEPEGKVKSRAPKKLRFVVQMHSATKLHFDLRLEMDGVYKSWAVPKGPSMNAMDQRLAVFVEDHPLEYGKFEGVIPKGNYGAGTVMVWDSGTLLERNSKNALESSQALLKGLQKGHITFLLDGEKLRGEFALIKLKKNEDKAWLLVKKRDSFSGYADILKEDRSQKTGRTIEEISSQAQSKKDFWYSKRAEGENPSKKSRTSVGFGDFKWGNTKPVPEKFPRKLKLCKPLESELSVFGNLNVMGQVFKDAIFEVFPRGTRCLFESENGDLRLISKGGLKLNSKFAKVLESYRQSRHSFVADVVASERGVEFLDLLFCDGKNLRNLRLSGRLTLLTQLLKELNWTSQERAGQFSAKKQKRAPYILVRAEMSPYLAGVQRTWQKIKMPEKIVQKELGSELLGGADVQEKNTPKPSRLATLDGENNSHALTHPIKNANLPEVNLENPKDGHPPQITHPKKVFFPKDEITKGQLIEYYTSIAPFILPHLVGRPQSLNRFPNGIEEEGFFQKDLSGYKPRWIATERVFSASANRTVEYLVCNNLWTLQYMVNLGCIEINPWISRVENLDHPDFAIIDLDPDGNPFHEVAEVALAFKEALESWGVKSYCKTSGATGIHIVFPLGGKYDFTEVRLVCEKICAGIQKKFPHLTSIERNPSKRRKRIYLDFLQNRRGQTLASPYCVRPRAGAPVSTPLLWSELGRIKSPDQFNIHNTAKRLKAYGEIWTDLYTWTTDLKKLSKKLLENE